jgi:hypothetical protein
MQVVWLRQGSVQRAVKRILLLIPLLLPAIGSAEDVSDRSRDVNAAMPRCGPETDGQVYCKFGVIYECQLNGIMERHSGWRWKADILSACSAPSPAVADQPKPAFTYAPERTYQPGDYDRPDVPCSSRPAARAAPDGTMPNRTMYVRPESSRSAEHGGDCN